jgi:hypothetical protein
MRILDLYEKYTPDVNLPNDVKHTLPHSIIFPDMDGNFEFYKFVVAMSCHPEIDDAFYENRPLRDVPIAVAYTPQEFEMMKQVAKRLGQRWESITTNTSQETPGGNKVSPVMKFNMTEAHIDIMKSLLEVMNNKKDYPNEII